MSRTILVAEDDPKTVDLIRLYLLRDRYRVLVARGGWCCAERYRTWRRRRRRSTSASWRSTSRATA